VVEHRVRSQAGSCADQYRAAQMPTTAKGSDIGHIQGSRYPADSGPNKGDGVDRSRGVLPAHHPPTQQTNAISERQPFVRSSLPNGARFIGAQWRARHAFNNGSRVRNIPSP
jgi:hypothetical protein